MRLFSTALVAVLVGAGQAAAADARRKVLISP